MRGEICCNDLLIFQTIRHREHYCKEPVGHADPSLNALREESKHECICGVKWTGNPELASRQQYNGETIDHVQWSEERDITPSRIPGEKKNPADNN